MGDRENVCTVGRQTGLRADGNIGVGGGGDFPQACYQQEI